MKSKRYLSYHYPELNSNLLPLNLRDTQLYVGYSEEANDDEFNEPATINVQVYLIPKINLYPSFHKPISKLVELDDYEEY